MLRSKTLYSYKEENLSKMQIVLESNTVFYIKWAKFKDMTILRNGEEYIYSPDVHMTHLLLTEPMTVIAEDVVIDACLIGEFTINYNF